MHTVFVNTSGTLNSINTDVLGIEKEHRAITQIHCPLSSWYDEDKGFSCCAREIGNQIDADKEIDNDYNLIIYVDLLELPEYVRMLSDLNDPGEKYIIGNVSYELLRGVLARSFAATLYEKLDELGRCPKENILLLLERNLHKMEKAGNVPTAQERKEQIKTEILLRLLGLPSQEEMEKHRLGGSEDWPKAIREKVSKEEGEWLRLLKPQNLYRGQINSFLESVEQANRSDKSASREHAVSNACREMLHKVEQQYENDCNSRVVVSEFVTDRRSGFDNVEENTKRDLLVQCLLLDCAHSQSIYVSPGASPLVGKKVPDVSAQQWTEIKKALSAKKKAYAAQLADIQKNQRTYTEQGLAPKLYRISHKSFGLNESGTVLQEYEIMDNQAKGKPAQKTVGNNQTIISLQENRFSLAQKIGLKYNWFTEQEFELFKHDPQNCAKDEPKLLSAEEYSKKATDIATLHLNFLTRLNLHVEKIMSRYAERDAQNNPPILRKRSVSTSQEDLYSEENDYKYTDGSKKEETSSLETVCKTSSEAYRTLLTRYLRFSAGRGVQLTDVSAQSEWFINRIHQIEESLKQISRIISILAAVLVFLMIPFVLIQWESIVKNLGTVLVAVVFLAFPFLLLGMGGVIASTWQKRKLRKVWRELVEVSNNALKDNELSVHAYDELLTQHIPALRWIYEYILDVAFQQDCCVIADAKREHHMEKLKSRVEMLGNILENLQCNDIEPTKAAKADIDYTISYCEGRNREFYSILDKEILRLFYTE